MPRPSYLLFPTRDNGHISDGVAVSSTTTYYSEPMLVGDDRQFSAVIQFTGTPTGTLTLWYSNKMDPDRSDDDDWDQDTDVTITSPSGSARKDRYEVGNIGARWFRFKYVNSSGSGVIQGRAVS